jgi:signal peptidase I
VSRGAKIGIGLAALFGVLVILWGAASVTDTLQQYRLPSESMEPSYDVGDRVMAGRNGFPFGKAGRGDVVITWAPRNAGPFGDVECARPQPAGASCDTPGSEHGDANFIKRIVAVGGDRIAIRGGRAVVNGKPLDEPYARLDSSCDVCELPREIKVPPGHVFTLGDNRANSVDSRTQGPIPEDWIRGKVLFKYWSGG